MPEASGSRRENTNDEDGLPDLDFSNIERIISDCFHTSSDGSAEHIEHLAKMSLQQVS